MQKDLRLEDFRGGFVKELFEYWLKSCAGRSMPSRDDMHPHEVSHLMGNVIMFDVLEKQDGFNRLKCRLAGTEVVRACGLDPTGYYLDNMPQHEGMSERFQWLVDHKKPYRNQADMTWLGEPKMFYESISLPLSTDGKQVDVLLCCLDFYQTEPND